VEGDIRGTIAENRLPCPPRASISIRGNESNIGYQGEVGSLFRISA